MFNQIKESAAAAVLAILLSATVIGATVVPAQANEGSSYDYVQAPVASTYA
jgi:hypothetical protein